MSTHITFLGWLYIGLGLLSALGALAAFGLAIGFSALTGDVLGFLVGSAIGGVIAIVMAITALPNILAGLGLLLRWGWARILALVLGVLNLFNFPLGTALGIYTFWVLLKDESKRQF